MTRENEARAAGQGDARDGCETQPGQAARRIDSTAPAPLEPCDATMAEHINMIASAYGGRDGLIEIAWDTGGDLNRARLFDPGDVDAMVALASEVNRSGHNVYIGPALRRPDAPRDARTTDKHVIAARFVWADFDDDGALDAALKAFNAIGVEPNWLTRTGETPHRRGQCFWMLTADAPLDEHRRLLADIARRLSGDSSVQNPGRVMRLAGSLAWPRKSGRVLEVTRALHEHTRHAPYEFADLRTLLTPPRDNGAATEPERSNGAAGMRLPHPDSKWAQAALEDACRELASTPPGGGDGKPGRNVKLNAEAFGLGQIVGGGRLDRAEVETRLWVAARQCGLDDAEIATVIPRAIEEGMKESRGPKNDAATTDDAFNAEIARLAAMAPLTYDTLRKSEADRLGVRVGTLDDAVKRARPRPDEDGDNRAGSAFEIAAIEPWDGEVNGASLLDELAAVFRRFVSLPAGAADVLALWVIYTYAFERFFISPRLAIRSPEKRCGKSTLLLLLAFLCNRVLRVDDISGAALFRVIEKERPTMILDEFDSFGIGREDIRNVVNSGYARTGTSVRCVGDDSEPRAFSTWSPVALASIGRIADTLEDRSIIVMMKRKSPSERFDRLRGDRPDQFDGLRRRAARFMLDVGRALENADPDTPASLNDRAADNWRPLLAIADAAGEDWPQRARNACKSLTDAAALDGEQDSIRTALLRDIRTVFNDRRARKIESGDKITPADEITSAELCDELAADDGGPWAAYGKQEKPITPVYVARLLKPFGISSKDIRNGKLVRKRFERKAFEDVWARYLPADTPEQPATPQPAHEINDLEAKSTRNNGAAVAGANAAQHIEKHDLLRCCGLETPTRTKGGEI